MFVLLFASNKIKTKKYQPIKTLSVSQSNKKLQKDTKQGWFSPGTPASSTTKNWSP
jgi:hypothetical protein